MADARHDTPAAAEAWPTPGRAWGIVGILTAAYFISYVDRSILSLLVEPIKRSLQISDTQVGLLQGAAFGVFFMLMTIPIGWLADRGNRVRLIALGIAFWSIMTVLCGVCSNFAQLFLARMGVAVGEATLTPTGPSLISDNFPPEWRTLPMSLYGLGALLGGGGALVAGGALAGLVSGPGGIPLLGGGLFKPWQLIFFAVGLPGLLLSLLFFLAKEPQRRDYKRTEGTLHELAEALKSRRAIIMPHFAGVCFFQFYASAFLTWLPAFFMRVHGWSIGDIGVKYGVVHLGFGIAGALVGGSFARVLWHRGFRDANLLTGAICFGGMTIPAVLGPLVSSAIASALLLGLTIGFAQAPAGANIAAIQEILPNHLRARVTAIYYAAMALSGSTFGPLLVGLMNDHLFTGELSIAKSMSLTALLTLPPSSVLLFIAARRRTVLEWAN